MNAETPKPGDRVRVIYEGVWHRRAETGHPVVRVDDVETPYPVRLPASASVEVLERADDPSKSLRGEVREIDGMAAVCYGKNMWVYFSALHNGATGGYGVYKDEQMVGTPVVGVVPGTPAAEAQREQQLNDALPDWERELIAKEAAPARRSVRVPNEPHGIPLGIRQQAAELLTSGNMQGAIGVLAAAMGMAESEALAYLEDMPEYQTYLNHHGRTEVAPEEADRMRAMGFDRQPEFKVSDEDRASIQAVLDERANEYVYGGAHGWKLDSSALTGVVADIVWAAIRRDRERGDR